MYILPFNDLSDQEIRDYLIDNLLNPSIDNLLDLDNLNSQVFNQFDVENTSNFANLPSNPDLEYFSDMSDLLNNSNYYFPDEYKTISNHLEKTNLSIACHNINSISKHIDEFVNNILTDRLDFDILSFTETKLTDNISNLFNIDGYNKFTLKKENNKNLLNDDKILLKIPV